MLLVHFEQPICGLLILPGTTAFEHHSKARHYPRLPALYNDSDQRFASSVKRLTKPAEEEVVKVVLLK